MGLMTSETMLIDLTLDDSSWLRERLSEWTSELDAAHDTAERAIISEGRDLYA